MTKKEKAKREDCEDEDKDRRDERAKGGEDDEDMGTVFPRFTTPSRPSTPSSSDAASIFQTATPDLGIHPTADPSLVKRNAAFPDRLSHALRSNRHFCRIRFPLKAAAVENKRSIRKDETRRGRFILTSIACSCESRELEAETEKRRTWRHFGIAIPSHPTRSTPSSFP